MITQLFKLLWKQRKFNSLMIVEIAFSFIALMALSATCIHFWKRYNEPLGMEYKNMWILYAHQPWNIAPELQLTDSVKAIKIEEIKKFVKNNYSEVLAVSKITGFDYVYTQSSSSSCNDLENKQICYNSSPTEPDLAKTFGMKILEGRWIIDEDRFSNVETAVINKKLKEELFGNGFVAGKTFYIGKEKPRALKIVGVFEALKKNGEFEKEPNFMLTAHREKHNPYGGVAIKLRPGISKNFEDQLIKDLNAMDKTYEFRIEKMEETRKYYLAAKLAPLIIIGSIVIFLIVNVMLGLFGMLWLNISRRKSEIGLRRAVGSTGNKIVWRILGETYVLALVSMSIGFLFTMQLFIYNLFDTPVATLVQANLLSLAIILILCTISAYAPARLAASLEPAEALHEE